MALDFLTSADLTRLRATLATSLVGSATVQRNTTTADGMGGVSNSWANLATGVTCRVAERMSATERVVAERLTSDVPWLVILPTSQDVTAKDRLSVSSVTYEVLAVNTGRVFEVGRRCLCRVLN